MPFVFMNTLYLKIYQVYKIFPQLKLKDNNCKCEWHGDLLIVVNLHIHETLRTSSSETQSKISFGIKLQGVSFIQNLSTINIILYSGRYWYITMVIEMRRIELTVKDKSPGCQTLHQGSQYTLFFL